MPLPFILGAAAAVAFVGGVGSAIHGAVKVKDANDTMKWADERHKENIARFDQANTSTSKVMDELGILELEILQSFDEFSDTIEKIQNRPQFQEYTKAGVKLPKYDKEELKKVSVGAGALLGGLGGAALGTAGGFAAAGATTSAVMALGTASTGTAIATLNGVALTNATLAALGGGSLAAGGGGMALGTTILGVTTLGAGILVGGIIFNFAGIKLSKEADEALSQMRKAEETIDKVCQYLADLKLAANNYKQHLSMVRDKYKEIFGYVFYTVNTLHKTDWNEFSWEERIATQNTVLLVGLLYEMCQVNLVNKTDNKNEVNSINQKEVKDVQCKARDVLNSLS